jgi:hypothetical protein
LAISSLAGFDRNGAANESAENYVIVDGIIVVPKSAVIPDGTVI